MLSGIMNGKIEIWWSPGPCSKPLKSEIFNPHICSTGGRTSAIRIRASSFSFVCRGLSSFNALFESNQGERREACFVYLVSWSGWNAGEEEELKRGMTYHPGLEEINHFVLINLSLALRRRRRLCLGIVQFLNIFTYM